MTLVLISAAMLTPQSITALGVEIGLLGLFWLTRYARFVRLFRGVQAARRFAGSGDRRALWNFEWVGWLVWVLAIAGSGVLLILGDPRAFYLLAIAIALAFPLIVWNAWVLMAEVAE